MEEYQDVFEGDSNSPETQEYEHDNITNEYTEDNNHSEDEVSDVIGNNIGGRYACTCGCTHFNDVGHNYCSCGHHWDRHKFWS